MEQKQLKMWLPSFLTWRAERVLQKQAEMGYLLIAVENFGSFYTFSVKAKLFCPEIAGLFCRIAGLFCHDSRANLSLKPVCFGIAIS